MTFPGCSNHTETRLFKKCLLLHGMQPLATRKKDLQWWLLALYQQFSARVNARSLCFAIDQDGTSPALAFSTAILGSDQIEILAQHCKKADLRIGIDCARTSNRIVSSQTKPGPAIVLPHARLQELSSDDP